MTTSAGAMRPGGAGISELSAESVMALMRANGGRATAARRVTIEVLLAGEHRHLSAEDVAAQVRERLPDVADSSIYRTLATLEELKLVTHVHLGHGASTFHLTRQTHRHLVCQRCDAVIEVPNDEVDALARRLDRKYGFTMSSEHFAILGECQACRARQT
ncbi:MAG TPA: Fur family transcriptional regulator [Acidimicrobiales bacterium]|nr:Fur family transcriptional regulator [Acidimicrobiales bacterium]